MTAHLMSPTMKPAGKEPKALADPDGTDDDQDGGDDPASAHRHLLGGILATWTK